MCRACTKPLLTHPYECREYCGAWKSCHWPPCWSHTPSHCGQPPPSPPLTCTQPGHSHLHRWQVYHIHGHGSTYKLNRILQHKVCCHNIIASTEVKYLENWTQVLVKAQNCQWHLYAEQLLVHRLLAPPSVPQQPHPYPWVELLIDSLLCAAASIIQQIID